MLGCKDGGTPPSSVAGGYTFTHDLDGERRVLRIETSAELAANCMQTQIPGPAAVEWKTRDLDPSMHRHLIDLLFDPVRVHRYAADTDATEKMDILTCVAHGDGSESCYLPRAVVTGVDEPLYFGLHPDVELSKESQDLVDEFLTAHEACWNDSDS